MTVLFVLGIIPTLLRAENITVDGSGDTFGMLPVVMYGLAEQTTDGEDILPTGDYGFALFGLFDTGSTGVAINANGTNFFFANDDATNLGIFGTRVVDVRINGLGATTQATPTSVTAPIGAPGSGFEPEVQVSGVAVGPDLVSVTLLGAPVANQVAARIDYTTIVTRTLEAGDVPSPDIIMMTADEAAAFTPVVEVALTPFGTVGQNADGEDRGQRYYIEDASMHYDGNSVTGFDFDLFWDSGTTPTIISTEIANLLGLDLQNPEFQGDVAGNILDGYSLDSIVLNGIGGSYTVNNAQIFVDPSPVPFGGAADAIIGANLFNQTSLLFNGPANILGIGQNSPPVADAGDDQTHECTSSLGASVTLDGTGSYDPDGDPLNYLWTGVFGAESGPTPSVTLPLGVNDVSLTVDDGSASDSDSMQVTVLDTTPPTVDAGPDVTLEATSFAGATYDVSTQVTASDVCGPVSLAISPAPADYPIGPTVVTVTATDSSGNTDSDTMTVTVVDLTPPDISITATPEILWPPNHNMIPIEVTPIVSDIADPNPTVELIFVQSDEGDGVDTFDPAFDTTEVVGRKGGDIQIVDGQLFLRAERAGNGDGRVYTITYEATDASGNSASSSTTVVVPHNQ